MSFNIDKTRSDFPILEKKVYDKKLIYLDNLINLNPFHKYKIHQILFENRLI